MKAFRLALIAAATALAFGNASAAEKAHALEIVVVTAERPVALQARNIVAIDEPTFVIDFASLPIDAPRLDPTKVNLKLPRIAVALGDEAESKS